MNDLTILGTAQEIEPLIILGTNIRQDTEGRYCLNACHKAAGLSPSKGPGEWSKNAQVDALVQEVRYGGNPLDPKTVVTTGPNTHPGTYAVKELVYAYAMWISPAFHLQVIRAFDGPVTGADLTGEKARQPEGLRNPGPVWVSSGPRRRLLKFWRRPSPRGKICRQGRL